MHKKKKNKKKKIWAARHSFHTPILTIMYLKDAKHIQTQSYGRPYIFILCKNEQEERETERKWTKSNYMKNILCVPMYVHLDAYP